MVVKVYQVNCLHACGVISSLNGFGQLDRMSFEASPHHPTLVNAG